MQDLLDVMRRLRAPDGCPWDRAQTHESLRPYLLEEAAEAVDAVGTDDLPGELGDVLFQVAFHSVLGEEAGTFDYAQVERSVVEKMIRRHPHVFGDQQGASLEQIGRTWQAIKQAEQGGRPRRAADRVPAALGALAREGKTQGLGHQDAAPRERVQATLTHAPESAEGVAEVLAAVVAWARGLGVDPELALRERTARTLAALPDAPEDGASAAPDRLSPASAPGSA